MKKSHRADRMTRHHKRGRRGVALNLVSLMDIFTILVFFLLVNSSDVQDLPSTRSIEMPESVSQDKPRETVVVLVSQDQILVDGKPVLSVADALGIEGNTLIPLKVALAAQSERMIRGGDAGDQEVTIMGDKTVPYRLLRKVMATCTEADYGRVSLAVIQRAPDGAGEASS
ncbi:MAG: biopolymer transporter ExbD [Chromatiales bacterium]|jgi:biopolymer transport protein ExbD|nr:biopolymer transporter ExbD [Chromatiales bacterium]